MANETLGQLQADVLASVLENRPLPGSTQPFTFPDLSFVRNQQAVIVADENLAEPRRIESLPFAVEVLPTSEIRERARREGNVAYLQFTSVERDGDTVWMTLKAEIAPREPTQGILGLSGARLGFRRRPQDGWELVAGPTVFAA